jgi:hypothetical protein
VRRSNNIARNVGLGLALLHTAAFLAMALYIYKSTDPQAPLLWFIFATVDFPLSLLYLLGGWLNSHSPHYYAALSEFLYMPYLIHGLLGAVWWYFLPKLITPRRLGGVW